jgi:beta-glucosidase
MTFRPHQFAVLLAASAVLQAAAPGDLEQRLNALLARMTLEEKLGQMSQAGSMRSPLSDQNKEEIRKGRWGSFLSTPSAAARAEAQRIALKESRLGIPLIFGRDVIHGYRTIFPIPLGQAASWDPELIEQAARLAAREASTEGIHWTFAPLIDVARDPRWGRIAESLGEDPYLSGVLGAAIVRGFQGKSLDAPDSIAACAKHYAGYGAAEAGIDYNTTWIPENLLRDVYLPSFRAARDAGVASFMTAFNALNGVPATGNRLLLRKILRDEWRFDGMVVSDYEAVSQMIDHGYALDAPDAAHKALRAGVDMEMVSTSYFDRGKALIETGKVDMKTVDDAVRNILRLKLRLGLFDKPVPGAKEVQLSSESLSVAERLASESIVLLKNDRNVLPMARATGKIAVLGPLADSPADQMGCWVMDGRPGDVQTPLAALRKMLGSERVVYEKALKNSRDTSRDGFGAAIAAARATDVVLLFLGEESSLSGEARSRAFLTLPGAQEALVDEITKVGKPVVAIILAGRPLTFHDVARKANAVLYAWHPGTMGGPALANILLGQSVPSGKLTVSLPRTIGQAPIYYAHLSTGRPPSPKTLGGTMGEPIITKSDTTRHLDVDYTPEYPFGYGLTYTTFEYSNLRLSAPRLRMGGKLAVSAVISNTGAREADEVVQLYVRDLVASVSRPVRELKGFRRIHLKPSEKQTVDFSISTGDLGFYNEQMQRVTEPGQFQVWVAPDSAGGVQGEFTVE